MAEVFLKLCSMKHTGIYQHINKDSKSKVSMVKKVWEKLLNVVK